MREIFVNDGMTSILLGRKGENEHTKIVFDIADWIEEYPHATFALINQKPNSTTEYPVVISQPRDGKVSWVVGGNELLVDGYGQCTLEAVEGNVVAKRHIWRTRIMTAMGEPGEFPEPWESWLTEFTRLKGEAEEAQEAAEDAAEDSEAWAVGQRGGVDVDDEDPTYENNAKYYAILAQTALDTAIAEAEAAADAAETAQGKAEDAQEAAEDAQADAEAAQAAAELAKSTAETAASTATTAAGNAATSASAAASSASAAANAKTAAETAQSAAATSAATANTARAQTENLLAETITAKNAAVTAQGKAEDAQDAAEDAQEAAEEAQTAAEAAQAGALVAQGKAEDAQEAAETAQGKAEDAQEAAEAAQTAAETAQGAAETAQTAAESAQSAAEDAQEAAEAAQEAAEEAAESIESSAAQIATNAEDISELKTKKADIDGSYENMTVGNAEQLVSTVNIEDSVPYNFRTAGGSADIGDRLVDKIVGGTVAWNQLADNTATSGNHYAETWASTLDIQNGTIKATTTRNDTIMGFNFVNKNVLFAKNHKYLMLINVKEVSFTATYVGLDIRDDWSSLPSASHTITYTGAGSYGLIVNSAASGTPGKNQRMIVRLEGTSEIGDYVTINGAVLIDLTQMFGSDIADYIYGIETATAGAGVAWFRKLFPKPYYAYNEGTLMSVQVEAHKTVGFNAWDEVWEVGSVNTSTGADSSSNSRIRSKNYIPVLPNTSYCTIYSTVGGNTTQAHIECFYDKNKNFISGSWTTDLVKTTPANAHYMRFATADAYGATYNNDICINLHWDGERDGEYEPYEEHVYPLDDSLELRGIPKLNANNELYYDGDTYESDGTVTRKYRTVDLGGLSWSKESSHFYSSVISGIKLATNTETANIKSVAYVSAPKSSVALESIDKSIAESDSGRIFIYDNSHSSDTGADFKTAMSGVYLVYELATPTTESSNPFQNPQIVDDFGTEEYVDAGVSAATPTRDVAIPVGHETQYQPNLRAKLEMAPVSPDGDGDYIVRQTNGENNYVPLVIPTELPANPGTDGTYILKATVTNGTTVLSWEVQS